MRRTAPASPSWASSAAIVGVGVALVLSGCASTPSAKRGSEAPAIRTPNGEKPPSPSASTASGAKRGGGYYLDDGPGDNAPPDLDLLPDAIPRAEKYASGANRPYNVFGTDYVPNLSGASYKQRGVGSWYGRKFHGQRTSSGEIYDMYAMTAAHPTLPIPCYALVTNVQNGKSLIVRVNDRGPFLHNRIMDLSYAAAYKLGYSGAGSAMLEVEMLLPRDIAAGRIPTTRSGLFASASIAANATMPASSVPHRDPGIPSDLIPLPDREPAPALPPTSTAAGYYLQLGAFRAKAGADSFASHLSRLIDPTLASLVHVSDGNGLYRVRVGPYTQRAEADTAASSVRSAIAQPVLVMPSE